jgi:Spy/CpxP family protein refolding chaperone
MKNKKLFALATAIAVLFGGFAVVKVRAAAEEKAARQAPFRGGAVLQKAIAELDLKAEQIDQIKATLRGEKDTLVTLLKQLHETKKNLREAIQSGGTETAIRAASAKVAAVEADLAVERGKLHSKIEPVLTDEQIGKVKAFEEKVDDFVIKAIKSIGDRLEQK